MRHISSDSPLCSLTLTYTRISPLPKSKSLFFPVFSAIDPLTHRIQTIIKSGTSFVPLFADSFGICGTTGSAYDNSLSTRTFFHWLTSMDTTH